MEDNRLIGRSKQKNKSPSLKTTLGPGRVARKIHKVTITKHKGK